MQLEGGEGGARSPDLPRFVRVVELPLLKAEGELLLENVLARLGLGIRFLKQLTCVLLATFPCTKATSKIAPGNDTLKCYDSG